MAMARPTAIDLFSGAGGLSSGFIARGFSVLAANDFDKDAEATFKLNHPDTEFVPGKIQGIEAQHLLDVAGLCKGELYALIGGPPCQAFSVYNHQRGMHDERSGLFREYLRIVDGLRPRFILMENVTGITSIENGRAVDEIRAGLGALGYHVETRILKSERYGIPQERRRIFFLGARDHSTLTWPAPTHGVPDEMFGARSGMQPYVTVSDTLSDLPELRNGEGAEAMDYTADAKSEYQHLLRQGSFHVFNHVAPQLAPINQERMRHIPQGGSWRDLPERLLPAGMRRARRSDHTKRYGRMDPAGLSCTVLTKCDPHWGAYIHPTQDRAITVREAARLQSFPDRFRFVGSRGEQYRQVGNAVPPLLAQAMAGVMLDMAELAKVQPAYAT